MHTRARLNLVISFWGVSMKQLANGVSKLTTTQDGKGFNGWLNTDELLSREALGGKSGRFQVFNARINARLGLEFHSHSLSKKRSGVKDI